MKYGGAAWDAKAGDKIELSLSPEEEAELIAAGRLELQSQLYEVAGSSEVFGHKQGEKFEAALALSQEAALIEGGHIKQVAKSKPAKKKGAR